MSLFRTVRDKPRRTAIATAFEGGFRRSRGMRPAATLALALVAYASGMVPAALLGGAGTREAIVIGLATLMAAAACDALVLGPELRSSALHRLARLVSASAVALLATLALLELADAADGAVGPALWAWLVAPATTVLTGDALRVPAGVRRSRTVVVGSGVVAQHVLELARRYPRAGLLPVAMVDDPAPTTSDGLVAASLNELDRVILGTRADCVAVAFSTNRDSELVEVVRACDRHRVSLVVVTRLYDVVGTAAEPRELGGIKLLALRPRPGPWPQRATKRAVDLLFVALLAVPVAMTVAVAALAIKLDDRGPVFFRQDRLGRGERPFRMLKLRTMVTGAEDQVRYELEKLLAEGADGDAVASVSKPLDDPRITRVGRFLRRTSLDELPQLWNVLSGEMSVVGPRPLPIHEGARLLPWERRRFDMRPGITGLWQVLGRSDLSWEERMQLDYLYVRNWTLASDVSILARTVGAVAWARGAR